MRVSNRAVLCSALAGHHLETAAEAQSGFSGPGTVWLQFLVSAPATQTRQFTRDLREKKEQTIKLKKKQKQRNTDHTCL